MATFSLLNADIAVVTPLISMGALLGKTTYMQLVFMGIFELIMFSVNKYVGEHVLMVSQLLLLRARLRASRSIFKRSTIESASFCSIPETTGLTARKEAFRQARYRLLRKKIMDIG